MVIIIQHENGASASWRAPTRGRNGERNTWPIGRTSSTNWPTDPVRARDAEAINRRCSPNSYSNGSPQWHSRFGARALHLQRQLAAMQSEQHYPIPRARSLHRYVI